MVRFLASSCALLAVATCAQADLIRPPDARADGNATFVYDLANNEFCAGPIGTTGNHWGTRNLNGYLGGNEGDPVIVHGFTWNAMVEAYAPSLIEHLGFAISDDAVSRLIGVRPAAPGSGVYSFAGSVDFTDVGLADLLLPNGVLRIEFFDVIDDLPGADGRWMAGTGLFISFDVTLVPAPATLLAPCAGLLALGRRRT